MGNTTKVDKGYLKTNYPKQKSAGVGFQHNEFYHEASNGALEIDFNALVLPSEVSAEGFSNPSPSVLIAAELKNNRGNLSLRSFRGDWVDRIDYTIQSNGKITLKKPAEDGEIFYGKIHNIIRNTLENPDLQSLVAVGTLTAGQTIFNVGKMFKVNENPLTQIGEIMVFRGFAPTFMLRNAGNAAASTSADGNYQEINSNGGYGSIIEFNDAGLAGEIVIVVATGRLLERPSNSLLQEIETLAGQLDNVIPYIEDLAGLAPGTLLAAPNNVDLKAFGDILLSLNTKYNSTSTLTDYVDSKSKFKFQTKTLASTVTVNGTVLTNLNFNNLVIGRAYKLTLNPYVSAAVGNSAGITVTNGAQLVMNIAMEADSTATTIQSSAGKTINFIATNATLTFTANLGASSNLVGDGSLTYTHAVLEELPNHETTTQWT